MTRTYAMLELSEAAYEEIKAKLEQAGYQHAFKDNPNAPASPTIDMHGIAIRPEVEMIGEEESLEGWPCRAGFAPR